MYVMGEPARLRTARRDQRRRDRSPRRRSPDEVAYDYLTADAGNFLFFPVTGYARDDHEPIREMLTDSGTLLGLGDGGAHVAMIVDASAPTYMLTHLGARPKARAGPAARIHGEAPDQRDRRLSSASTTAAARAGQARRSQPDRLRPPAPACPEVVNDLPAGGKRLVQRADGYGPHSSPAPRFFEQGEHTGAKPGRLVRRGR